MKELSQREAAFAVHFTTIGSDTFSDGKKSAIAAGYSEKSAHVAASRLLKREKVYKHISELHSENMQRNLITVDKVLADLEHDKILARKHNQYAVAKGCTELQGKYLSMFTDRLQTEETEQVRELTEREQEQYKRIAQVIMNENLEERRREFSAGSDTEQEGSSESL